MLAVNYSNYRESLKHYCDRVNDESETLIVTRKAGGNVVMLSEDQYNNLMENLYIRANPANYANLTASIGQMRNGSAQVHDLIQEDDCEGKNSDE